MKNEKDGNLPEPISTISQDQLNKLVERVVELETKVAKLTKLMPEIESKVDRLDRFKSRFDSPVSNSSPGGIFPGCESSSGGDMFS